MLVRELLAALRVLLRAARRETTSILDGAECWRRMPEQPLQSRGPREMPRSGADLRSSCHKASAAGRGKTLENSLGRRCHLIQQMRIYEIFERNRAAFYARFEQHAMRIMGRYGFDIVAMWESTLLGGPRFVYILNWPDIQAKETAWR